MKTRIKLNASFSLRMYKLWCKINDYPEGHFKTLDAWVNNRLL